MESLDTEVPLLEALPLIQGLIYSCRDRTHDHYTKSQLTILAVLFYRGSITMKEVSHYIGSSSEQATRAVAPLADAELIERFTDPANRQHVHIRLTAMGRSRVKSEVSALSARLETLLRASLADRELCALRSALKSVISLLRDVC